MGTYKSIHIGMLLARCGELSLLACAGSALTVQALSFSLGDDFFRVKSQSEQRSGCFSLLPGALLNRDC